MHAWAFSATLVLCQSIFISSTPTVTCSTKTIVSQPQTVLARDFSSLTYLQPPTAATIVNATSTAPTPPHLFEAYSYNVPDTSISLRLWPDFLIDPAVLDNTIYFAWVFAKSAIEHGSTGPLPKAYDPFESYSGFGAVVSLTSVCFTLSSKHVPVVLHF